MLFTVFGATGFIGSHLVASLKSQGHECFTPGRDEIPENRELGHVFYCIGLTADFRTRLGETVEAHVCHFMKVLTRCRFKRICYLSSTRVYPMTGIGEESADIRVNPAVASDLYNISKLMGESACLNVTDAGVVVRLSNVFHADDTSGNFLNEVIKEAQSGSLILHTGLDSSKDYIVLNDVVDMLPRILVQGKERIYNLASGANVTHRQIVEALGCEVTVAEGSPTVAFPPISVKRLTDEFDFAPAHDILEAVKGR